MSVSFKHYSIKYGVKSNKSVLQRYWFHRTIKP